jgi:enamine deaminase RidA (YjgF/YER057c/UK114 family)
MSELFLAGLTDPGAAATVRRHGHSPVAAAEQAQAVFALLHEQLARAGANATDVCKITMQITDRAYRQAVYGVLGRALAGVWPVSTGLIVKGLLDPDALFQLDAYAVAGGPHERMRRYRSSNMPYGRHTQSFSMDFCMVVRAGPRIFLRGQTGMTIEGDLIGAGDPAAQARQAVENVRILLADAGADFGHATRLVSYVTDRAYLRPVLVEVEAAFASSPVASTELVVKGLAAPEILMEIDVHATRFEASA